MLTRAPALLHAVVVVVLIIAYTVLTETGHSADQLLGGVLAYLAGAGAQAGAQKLKDTKDAADGS